MANLLLRLLLLVPLALPAMTTELRAQELPKRDGTADLDFVEPKLMLNDLPDQPLPPGFSTGEKAAPATLDIARVQADLERARKTAASRERLWKAGVLAKVEAEQAALKVVRLTNDLATTQLQAATRELEEARKRVAAGEISQQAVATVEAALAAASRQSAEADDQWKTAQREAAELRVRRERKLLALGAGTRSAVKRAEPALQSLTPANTP